MFVSTRGYTNQSNTFLDVVRKGLAPDGGLFVPTDLPKISIDEISDLQGKSYEDQLFEVLSRFDLGIESHELQSMIYNAYEKFHHSKRVPLVEIGENEAILELYWGPTASFKDMALQLTPHFFSKSKIDEKQKFCILTATSGDTGIAAIEGFRKIPKISIVVLYPKNGVSQAQKLQMQSVDADNVKVVGVDGDFDFCQSTVKQIFNDDALKDTLQSEYHTNFSAANSMNWGRLLPQIGYYFSAYAQALEARRINLGDEIEVCVPSGNFGNILGAYIAREMGLPISKFIVAANENNILAEFFQTGIYDISKKKLIKTDSPSIDILKSSNIERFLYFISDGDTEFVSQCFRDLENTGKFELPDELKNKIIPLFQGSWTTETDMQKTIREVYEQSDYLLDPHTAVAVEVSRKIKTDKYRIIAGTAHYQKFAPAMARVFGFNSDGNLKGLFTILDHMNSSTLPHPDLEELLTKEAVQNTTCNADYTDIVNMLKAFIAK